MSLTPRKPQESSPFVQATTRALITFIVLALLVLGWQAVKLDLNQLFNDSYLMGSLLDQLLHPNVFERERSKEAVLAKFRGRCGDIAPKAVTASEPGKPTLTLSRDCGNDGDPLTLEGAGFAPNTQVTLNWARFNDRDKLQVFTTNAQGSFRIETKVERRLGSEFSYEAISESNSGAWKLTDAANVTLDKMYETIMLALMATLFGVIIAIPLSFFGARNLMADLNGSLSRIAAAVFIGAHGLGLGLYLGDILNVFAPTPTITLVRPFSLLALGLSVIGGGVCAFTGLRSGGLGVYYLVRLYQNVFRSIESLIVATLFVVWVGIGPAAGTLALAVNTAAVLGKLCSEAIESIDPGPMEAIKSTGANFLQTVAFAVLPQVIPSFISFILYRWDGNVRFSTVLGFVGGGGVGFILIQYINLLQYRNAAVAVWAITLVVYLMDYTSTKLRASIV